MYIYICSNVGYLQVAIINSTMRRDVVPCAPMAVLPILKFLVMPYSFVTELFRHVYYSSSHFYTLIDNYMKCANIIIKLLWVRIGRG